MRLPPVPIPNTDDKLTSVSGSTGVGDPLGNPIRRHQSLPTEERHLFPVGYHYYPLSLETARTTFGDVRLQYADGSESLDVVLTRLV